MFRILMAAAFILTLTTTAWATPRNYDIKLDVSLKGKKVASPLLRVVSGEKASIMENNSAGTTYIELVASEDKKMANALMVEVSIWKVDENATRTLLSRPRIHLRENTTAAVTQGSAEAPIPDIALSVMATAVDL